MTLDSETMGRRAFGGPKARSAGRPDGRARGAPLSPIQRRASFCGVPTRSSGLATTSFVSQFRNYR